jgi:hypothetical protein
MTQAEYVDNVNSCALSEAFYRGLRTFLECDFGEQSLILDLLFTKLLPPWSLASCFCEVGTDLGGRSKESNKKAFHHY